MAVSVGRVIDPYDINNPIYEDWEDFMAEFNRTAPDGLNRAR